MVIHLHFFNKVYGTLWSPVIAISILFYKFYIFFISTGIVIFKLQFSHNPHTKTDAEANANKYNNFPNVDMFYSPASQGV